MIRISTIFLCLLLAAAAAGRYQAEVAVREARTELRELEEQKAEELRAIQMLRAEVAYLENPDRLAKIARSETELRPTAQDQSVTAMQLAAILNGNTVVVEELPPDSEAIKNAIAMAQLASAD